MRVQNHSLVQQATCYRQTDKNCHDLIRILPWLSDIMVERNSGVMGMHIVRSSEAESAAPVGFSTRALVLVAGASDTTLQRIAGLGCQVEREDELFSALDKLLTDPSGYGLFIMDADAFGGLEDGERAYRLLGDVVQRVPMIIYSTQCHDQVFPQGRESPTILRAPLSAISLRVGVENVLRARSELYA